MKLGVSSMFFGDMQASELFSLLGKHPNAIALDLWYDTPFYLLENDTARPRILNDTKELLKKLSLEVVTHAAAFDVNPIAYSPAMQRHTLAETQASLLFANQVGAKHVTLHGGFSSFGSRVSRYDMVLFERFLIELLEFIENEKLGIILCLENDAASDTMSRPLESLTIMNNLLEKYSQLGITLDISHVMKSTMNMASCRVQEPRLDAHSLSNFLEINGKRVRVVHVSCPNKYRTHGRCDISTNVKMIDIIRNVASHVDLDVVPCIFEYALEEFSGADDAMDSIASDALLLSEKLRGE